MHLSCKRSDRLAERLGLTRVVHAYAKGKRLGTSYLNFHRDVPGAEGANHFNIDIMVYSYVRHDVPVLRAPPDPLRPSRSCRLKDEVVEARSFCLADQAF
jgi:hypothetical protein